MLSLRPTPFAALFFLALASVLPAAAQHQRTRGSHGINNNLRRRLHVNSLITDPGTFECEWSSLSDPGDAWYLSTTWKANFGNGDGFWGRTEWSLNFDALQRFRNSGQPVITHATDHFAVTMTTALPDWARMQWAVAPSANFLLRGDSGSRLGAVVLGKAERGRHSGGLQLGWSGATHPSGSNPAGTASFAAGYAFRLGEGHWSSRTSLYSNLLAERSTGLPWLGSAVAGLELQVTSTFAIDCNAQLQSAPATPAHFQTSLGITWNLGRIRR